MTGLAICLLGTFRVEREQTSVAGFVSNKVRGLLAYLVVESSWPHPREALAALFWPESSQEAALGSLRNALSNLRKVIGDHAARPSYLLITPDTVQFNRGCEYNLDIEQLLRQETVHQNSLTPCQIADIDRRLTAVAVYNGAFLAGFSVPDSAAFEEWISLWRERLRQLAHNELCWLAEQYEACGEYVQALDCAQRQVALEPWSENAHRQVMRILALSDQRGAALVHYESCQRSLAAELGVAPAEETRRLYEAIRAGDLKAVRSLRILPTPGQSPYRGLFFFDEVDADLFFGREALSARLAEQVAEMAKSADCGSQVLAVVGASGSGKSSLVRAGLLPKLRKMGWNPRIITPTAHPLAELVRCWHWLKPSKRLPQRNLLIIDQFEELFSLCSEESEREAFLERIFEPDLLVILMLRADYYGRCAAYPRLRSALSKRQEYIGAMETDELRRAIEEPARRGGWEFEAGLVDLLLQEVGATGDRAPEPGGLPLLEHALLETWLRRSGRVLTLAGYQESGGVRGAITRTAERVYACFSREEKSMARQVFLLLTELGEDILDSRRRATIHELRAIGENERQVDGLLEALASARLVTLGDMTVEVAHEALIREWPTLQGWLTEDREGMRLHRQVSESAVAWERLGRDEGELYRGARLVQAWEWAGQGTHTHELSMLETDFLSASYELKEREARRQEQQRQRELEAERERAEERAQAAQRLYQESQLSFARELAAYSKTKLAKEHELSLLLALRAVGVLQEAGQPVPWDVQQAVHDVVLASRLIWSRATLTQPWRVRFSPDGKRLLYDDFQDVHILDASSGEELVCLPAEGAHNVAFGPDGIVVATANSRRACLWDSITGEKLVTFPIPGFPPSIGMLHAFSPDGRFLLVNRDAKMGLLMDLRPWLDAGSPSSLSFSLPMKMVEGCSWHSPSAAFSPDGKMFTALSNDDLTIILWDSETVQPLRGFVGHTRLPMGVVFSPDGRRLASCAFDGTVRLWDVESARELRCLVGHSNRVQCIEYSPDGRYLASSGAEGAIMIWDAADGRKLFELPTGGANYGVAFSPDGERLFTSQLSGSMQMWDIRTCGPGEIGTMRENWTNRKLSPDGTRILDVRGDHTLAILDINTLQQIDSLQISPEMPIRECAFSLSYDNKQIAVISPQNLEVWDLKTREKIVERAVEEGARYFDTIVFHPDGKRLVFSAHPGQLIVWDQNRGRPDLVLPFTLEKILCLDISPNGRFLAVGGILELEYLQRGDVWLWDLELPAKSPLVFQADLRAIRCVNFSADSQRLAVSGSDSHAEIRDVSLGEPLMFLRGHNASVRCIRYSPDGRFLISGSEDGTVKVWDVHSGMEKLSLHVPGQGIVDIACFTPDSRRIVTAGDDGYFRLLVFQDFHELIEIARLRATRDWKPEERSRYLRSEASSPGA